MTPVVVMSSTLKNCHPERSQAVSKANHLTQSKDPYPTDEVRVEAGNFRIVALPDHKPLRQQPRSREAAKECSPRRKPWDSIGRALSPEGAKENTVCVANAMPSI